MEANCSSFLKKLGWSLCKWRAAHILPPSTLPLCPLLITVSLVRPQLGKLASIFAALYFSHDFCHILKRNLHLANRLACQVPVHWGLKWICFDCPTKFRMYKKRQQWKVSVEFSYRVENKVKGTVVGSTHFPVSLKAQTVLFCHM